MPSRLAIETALNAVILILLVEVYLMPPRGWTGGPLAQLFCTFITCLALVLLVANVMEWAVLYIKHNSGG